MEDCKDKRKRVNVDDSDSNSPELKVRRRVDSDSDSDSGVYSGESCLNELAFDNPASAGGIQHDILDILEDTEIVAERDSVMQGLDSVIKSFEEEILAAGSDPGQNPEHELQMNLGYLLEASDDELGLPPSTLTEPNSVEPDLVGTEGVNLEGFVGFDDDIPNYDVFGTGFTAECGGYEDGFTAVDGLFEYSEPSDILWRSESLQAM